MTALDTNVLIYACDKADPRRQQIALNLIAEVTHGISSGKWRVSSSASQESQEPETSFC